MKKIILIINVFLILFLYTACKNKKEEKSIEVISSEKDIPTEFVVDKVFQLAVDVAFSSVSAPANFIYLYTQQNILNFQDSFDFYHLDKITRCKIKEFDFEDNRFVTRYELKMDKGKTIERKSVYAERKSEYKYDSRNRIIYHTSIDYICEYKYIDDEEKNTYRQDVYLNGKYESSIVFTKTDFGYTMEEIRPDSLGVEQICKSIYTVEDLKLLKAEFYSYNQKMYSDIELKYDDEGRLIHTTKRGSYLNPPLLITEKTFSYLDTGEMEINWFDHQLNRKIREVLSDFDEYGNWRSYKRYIDHRLYDITEREIEYEE